MAAWLKSILSVIGLGLIDGCFGVPVNINIAPAAYQARLGPDGLPLSAAEGELQRIAAQAARKAVFKERQKAKSQAKRERRAAELALGQPPQGPAAPVPLDQEAAAQDRPQQASAASCIASAAFPSERQGGSVSSSRAETRAPITRRHRAESGGTARTDGGRPAGAEMGPMASVEAARGRKQKPAAPRGPNKPQRPTGAPGSARGPRAGAASASAAAAAADGASDALAHVSSAMSRLGVDDQRSDG